LHRVLDDLDCSGDKAQSKGAMQQDGFLLQGLDTGNLTLHDA
jgi:hypothetical protein